MVVHFLKEDFAHKSNVHAATHQYMQSVLRSEPSCVSPFHHSFSASVLRSTTMTKSNRGLEIRNMPKSSHDRRMRFASSTYTSKVGVNLGKAEK